MSVLTRTCNFFGAELGADATLERFREKLLDDEVFEVMMKAH